jgi:hypothetical protein
MMTDEIFQQAKGEIEHAALKMGVKFGISTDRATIMILEGVKMGITIGQKITQEVERRFASRL